MVKMTGVCEANHSSIPSTKIKHALPLETLYTFITQCSGTGKLYLYKHIIVQCSLNNNTILGRNTQFFMQISNLIKLINELSS
jgi:hypothetical protein